MLAVWSLVLLPFLNTAWTTGIFFVHVLLKPHLENFKHYIASVWDECNCMLVWTFFGIAFRFIWSVNTGWWNSGLVWFVGLVWVHRHLVQTVEANVWSLLSILYIHIYIYTHTYDFQFSWVAQSCLTLYDPMNCSTASLPVHHQFLEFNQIHVHQVGDDIQPSHPLSSPSPPAPNPSQQV